MSATDFAILESEIYRMSDTLAHHLQGFCQLTIGRVQETSQEMLSSLVTTEQLCCVIDP